MNKKEINVLLVDDNAGDARLVNEMLNECSGFVYKVTHVELLELALKRLKEEKFDVLILDLDLPDSYGIKTLETAFMHNPFIPIIVLTGDINEETGIEAIQKQANDYLMKSEVNKDILIRSIRYAIGRKEAEMVLIL